jgi:DNA polymerase III delta prime subunit
MDETFIFKYKPQSIDELELDSNLIILLNLILNINELNLLIIGNTGSGKSSLINIILNKYFKNTDITNNENILYINNLNEQGIQYFRTEVKTFCQTTKNKLKKIIVIDDIDLINEQSQQVFRNCIDKYKKNVHFLCSCTNTQKVIESIQSRLNPIKISKPNERSLENILNKISNKEGFVIDNDAKKELIKLINKPIKKENVTTICTNICNNDFDNFTELCKNNNLQQAIHVIMKLQDRGFSVMDILDSYFVYIKYNEHIKDNNKYEIVKLICKYITVFHNIHEDEIELA